MTSVVPSQIVAFIDAAFPFAKEQKLRSVVHLDGGSANQVAALLGLIDNISPELLVLEGQATVEFLASAASLRNAVDRWREAPPGRGAIFHVPGLRELSPVALIRQALSGCPDSVPPADITTLTFIADVEFRERLRLDLAEAETAFHTANWKAATVVGGSVVEALLLWVVLQAKEEDVFRARSELVDKRTVGRRTPEDLNEWSLHGLAELALTLGLITESTANQVRLAREFRNLIHPGRAVRLQQVCDRGTTLSALAAVEHVVRDLSSRLSLIERLHY